MTQKEIEETANKTKDFVKREMNRIFNHMSDTFADIKNNLPEEVNDNISYDEKFVGLINDLENFCNKHKDVFTDF